MYIDVHCHLDDAQFAKDLDAVIGRAQDAGISAVITAGVDVESSRVAVGLAERYDIVYAVVGIHPHRAGSYSDLALGAIRELALHRKVVGIGEIGLDLHYDDHEPREVQERCFSAQLDVAARVGKPVVIHDRDAHVELMTILTGRSGYSRGILHCFSGDWAMAQQASELGYLISFAGNLTFKNAARLQEVAVALALEHIVVETDAPYLSPRRGGRNEPQNVVRVVDQLAALKNMDPSVAALATTNNAERLFGLRTPK